MNTLKTVLVAANGCPQSVAATYEDSVECSR